MTVEFKLPDLGEGIHEAEIIAVKVKEGETVKEDQVIFEVETDKAVVEIPSPYAGVVEKIYMQAGQTVTVGSVMISYDLGGAKAAQAKADTAQSQSAAAAAPAKVEAKAAAAGNGKPATSAGALDIAVDRSRPVPATPATRRLARELGVDLYAVRGSGAAGRVMKEDVMAFAAGTLESRMSQSGVAESKSSSTATATAAPAASKGASMAEKFGGGGGGNEGPLNFGGRAAGGPIDYPDFAKFGKVERLPLKSIRRKIAQSMTQSWTLIPHVTTFDEANVTDLSKLITKYEKEFAERSGNPRVRPTMTVFVLKAVASALQRFPQFNSSLDENTGEIVIKHYYNLGVAVATDRGLIVPVIKNINEKSFYDVAVELADIAAKTRAGKIELDRLQGGTFTVTNIGAIGGTGASPMINFPECAILGMARATEKPIVKNGAIEIGTIMPLFMSFDHRLADGAEAAYFVQHVVKLLEDPFKFVLDI
ncbi:MAG: 2-oxo acid dehydrogenase subunit E2 [Cyanobacteria bacterium SZAS TMP-1]|nr:2-oxo acid dehydrogenase subunit E2 [Cyanobacteria bacterium SZAS TMP-1]